MNTFITMFLSLAGLAGAGLLISSFFGGRINLRKIKQSLFQKQGQQKIEEIEKKKEKVVEKITESEKVSEETKKKIVEIKKEAQEKIKETLKKEDVVEILMEDDEIWNW
jgi:tRNA 2-selenouridine synthase SelU